MSEVIKEAYRQLSKIYHPDASNQDDTKFKLIKEAFDVLTDEHKRYEYDKIWRNNQEKDNSNNIKEEINIDKEEFSNLKIKVKKATLPTNKLILVGVAILIVVLI